MLERSLLKKLNSNNQETSMEAYRLIYEDYHKLVYFICCKYLKVEADIEDIIIETFVAMYNNRSSLSNVKYFLTTTAKNKAINLAKKNSSLNLNDASLLETYESSEENSSYKDIMDEIYKCLDKEEAEIVISHVIEETSLVDIAKTMNTSVNTVKSKYRRAVKKLNKYLGDTYEE